MVVQKLQNRLQLTPKIQKEFLKTENISSTVNTMLPQPRIRQAALARGGSLEAAVSTVLIGRGGKSQARAQEGRAKQRQE